MTSDSDGLFQPERSRSRKRPVQARSRVTVKRIKDALLAVTEADGFSAASTNRIARAAGVNIASLYQYFPNREAIALAVLEDAAAELAQRVNQHLLSTLAAPTRASMRGLAELLVDSISNNRVALLSLPEQVPALRLSAQSLSLETLAYHTGDAYLRQRMPECDEATLRCKLFFVQHMGMGLIRRFVQEKPPFLSKARFVEEFADVLTQYLDRAATDTAGTRRRGAPPAPRNRGRRPHKASRAAER